MTDEDIVKRVAMLFVRAVVRLPPRKAEYKTAFATVVKGTAAVHLMKSVRPYVGPARLAAIDRAIASWHGEPERWRGDLGRCAIESCARPAAIKGLCKQHYKGWWKATRVGRQPRATPSPPESRLSISVDTAMCTPGCGVEWLAGLLEGEGTFTLTRSGTLAYPVVSVNMCDRIVIERAQRVLAAAGIWPKPPRRANWSMTFVTQVSGQQAAEWMVRLRPLMGERRRAAIDKALAAYAPIRLTDPPETCVVPGCDATHRSRGLCTSTT